MNVDIFHCGLITSFIYTVIYVAKNDTIIEYNYIKNISFQSDICGIFDVVFLQYPISFIAVFQGPAPLLSCRTSLIFIQGMYESLKIPTVLLSGNNFYKYNFFDIVIIQNFCGNYVLIEKKKKNKLIDIIELENKNFINQRVALVSREGHTISINEYYNQLLFPNLNSLVKIAYKKYKNNKIITESKEIVPFL